MSNAATIAPQKPRRGSLVLLILLFALPPIAGWLFFLNPGWLPSTRSNNGVIIEPARPISDLQLKTRDGTIFDWKSVAEKWLLVHITDGHCTKVCIDTINSMGRIRKAVGADRQRIERVLIMTNSDQNTINTVSHEQLDGAILLTATANTSGPLKTRFTLEQSTQPNGTYLIDPMGLLMMQHSTKLTEEMTLRDLEKLLKASQNWANGGQYGHR